jgi:hypothetical protein
MITPLAACWMFGACPADSSYPRPYPAGFADFGLGAPACERTTLLANLVLAAVTNWLPAGAMAGATQNSNGDQAGDRAIRICWLRRRG